MPNALKVPFVCPLCAYRVLIPANCVGRTVHCPGCSKMVLATVDDSASASAPSGAGTGGDVATRTPLPEVDEIDLTPPGLPVTLGGPRALPEAEPSPAGLPVSVG